MGDSAAFEAGQQVGYVIGMLFPLIIGIVVAWFMRRKRDDKSWPALPILVGGGLTLLGFLGNMMNG